MATNRIAQRLVFLTSLAFPGAAFAATVDAYFERLSPNPALPVTQARVLWSGAYCDAPACPPGTTVTQQDDYMHQSVVANAIGQRTFEIDGSLSSQVVAHVDDVAHRLVFEQGNAEPFSFSISYFQLPLPPGMSADFTEGGTADAFGIQLSANPFPPGASISGYIQVQSRIFEPNNAAGEAPILMTGPGLIIVPFSSFNAPIDFSDIDEFRLTLDVEGGDLDPSFSPISSVVRVTPAAPASWGGIKSIYR